MASNPVNPIPSVAEIEAELLRAREADINRSIDRIAAAMERMVPLLLDIIATSAKQRGSHNGD